jgi:hypothetical protein
LGWWEKAKLMPMWMFRKEERREWKRKLEWEPGMGEWRKRLTGKQLKKRGMGRRRRRDATGCIFKSKRDELSRETGKTKQKWIEKNAVRKSYVRGPNIREIGTRGQHPELQQGKDAEDQDATGRTLQVSDSLADDRI